MAADFGRRIAAEGPAKAEGQQRERRSADESSREVRGAERALATPGEARLQQHRHERNAGARLNRCDMPAQSHGHDYDVVPVPQTG